MVPCKHASTINVTDKKDNEEMRTGICPWSNSLIEDTQGQLGVVHVVPVFPTYRIL
jgi:hypothetical protein